MKMANDTHVEVTNVYERNVKATAKTVVNKGGAGSSKTISLCQFFIFERLLVKKNYRLLVLRKTRVANRTSVYEDFIALLQKYGIYDETNHHKSFLTYRIPENNSFVRFTGLDDYQAIKSTGWHDIWIEEANQVTKRDYLFLRTTRLYRGEIEAGTKARVWLSFNPEQCWIKDLEKEEDTQFINSTWRDNPFVNEAYTKELMGLKDQDDSLWQIYDLGEWAELKNVIYKPYVMESTWHEEEWFNEIIYGIDFGFNVQTAVLKIGEHDKEYWLDERVYKTRMTNQDLIQQLQIEIPQVLKYRPIYADNAEPARIEEIRQAGFNIFPCVKGKMVKSNTLIKDRIDYCKRQKYHTKKENVNLNNEREQYSYKEDKDGNVIDDPVKFRDHLMNAKEYAIYTHWGIRQEIYEEEYEEERGIA